MMKFSGNSAEWCAKTIIVLKKIFEIFEKNGTGGLTVEINALSPKMRFSRGSASQPQRSKKIFIKMFGRPRGTLLRNLT